MKDLLNNFGYFNKQFERHLNRQIQLGLQIRKIFHFVQSDLGFGSRGTAGAEEKLNLTVKFDEHLSLPY